MKNPLSVFLMINSFETGGTERQFVLLANRLRERGSRVTLGCLIQRGGFMQEAGEAREFPLGGSLYALRSWKSRWELFRFLRSQRFDIAHSFDLYANIVLIPVARLARVPAVLGSHRQLGDCFRPSQLRVQRLALRLADRVVCNSRAAAETVGLPERKLSIIHNGLPEKAFGSAEPAFGREPEVIRIGMIARMNDPVKNYPGFLRAASRLVQKYPQLEFLLLGDGPLRPELERLARDLGLAGKARFLGERSDVQRVLASLDVSVLPSRSESLPNVIMESMAAGVPVVATRVGGSAELVRDGETGFLVPPDDDASLASAVARLVADASLRAGFANRAREVARANFSADMMASRYESLYTTLLSRRSAGRLRSEASEGSRRAARVAIVAPSLRYIGGQSAQADLLTKRWAGDPDIDIRFIPVDPELPRAIAWAGEIPYIRTCLRTPLYLLELWKGLKGADVAHIFSASYWSFLLAPAPALLVAKVRGAKTVINYRSGEAKDHLSRWRSALPVLRRADALIVPSGYLVDVFRGFGLKARAIPNVIDDTQFVYRPRRPLRPALVCTRGFGAYYSTDLVVRAFAEVQKKWPGATLLLAGTGQKESQVRALVEELGLRGVEFTGAVSRDLIGQCHDRADISINASWLDNMPVSIIEAFAAGTPVVTTAPEGIRYIVRHEETGLMCEPGDWQGLAQNVLRLLDHPELAASLAANAYAESKKYRWESVRSHWLELYCGLATGAAPFALAESAARHEPEQPPESAAT